QAQNGCVFMYPDTQPPALLSQGTNKLRRSDLAVLRAKSGADDIGRQDGGGFVCSLLVEEFRFESVGNAGFDKFLVDAPLVVGVEEGHCAITSILEGWPQDVREVVVEGPTGTRQFYCVIAVA